MTSMNIEDGLRRTFEHVRDGTAWNRAFEGVVGGVEAHINTIQTRVEAIPTQINGIADNIVNQARNIESRVTAAAERLPDVVNHITNQFDNIANNITTFASSQGLTNALAGRGSGCSNLADFFGSITTTGPQIVAQVTSLVNEINTEIERFTTLANSLQGMITSARTQILTQLNAEIASVVNDAQKLASLQALRTTITNEFQSAVASVRSDLTSQVQAAISQERAAALNTITNQMRSVDVNILGSSNLVHELAGHLDTNSLSLHDLIGNEQDAINAAVGALEQLGAASSMRSLMNSNPCVQTLMGFLGTDSFLHSLRI